MDSKGHQQNTPVVPPGQSPFHLPRVKVSTSAGCSDKYCESMKPFENFLESKILELWQRLRYMTLLSRGINGGSGRKVRVGGYSEIYLGEEVIRRLVRPVFQGCVKFNCLCGF